MRLNLEQLRLLYSTQCGRDVRQNEVAAETGIHPNLYGRYEGNGVRRPDLGNLHKIYLFYLTQKLQVEGRLIKPGDVLTV